MSRRTSLVGALSVLVLAPVAYGVPAVAAPQAPPVAASVSAEGIQAAGAGSALLRASQRNLIAGETITLTAKAKPKTVKRLTAKERRKARLVLQRRAGSRWRAVDTTSLKRALKGKAAFSYSARANASGTVRLRTVVKVGKRQLKVARLRLPVVAQQLSATPASLVTSAPLTYAASLTPARAGRELSVQIYQDGVWAPLGTPGSADRAGAASLGVDAAGYPAWYRVSAAEWNGVPALTTEPVRTTLDKVPGLVAHRAGAGSAPEQTLAAVRQSVASGVASMEVDVQLTKDREPVILHDTSLARTTNVEELFPDRAPYNLADFTLAEVQTLDAGSWFGPAFAGERIPTLDEVLAEIAGRAHLVLEVKDPGLPSNEQVDEVLAEELATGSLGAVAAARKLTLSSFDHAWLQVFATAHPDVPVGVLNFVAPSAAQLDAWQTWAEEIHPNVALSTRADLAEVRRRGLTSSVWTVNSPAQFRAALTVGADRIITDFPALLAEVLDPPRPS